MLEISHFFQPMKMNGKIEKLTINIVLICENDNYCEPVEAFNFIIIYRLLDTGQSLTHHVLLHLSSPFDNKKVQ